MRIQAITVRFNMESEADRAAWERITAIRRKEHLSMSRAIIRGLNEPSRPAATSVPTDELTREIADGIMNELHQTLPAFIAGCVAGAALTSPVSALSANNKEATAPAQNGISAIETAEATVSTDLHPDFSRSHADWSFLKG